MQRIRKILSFTLFVVLAVGVVGFAPRPVAAATISLADLMPADVGVYADLKTADFDKTVSTFTDLLKKAGIPVPANLYADIDKGLTQLLGRPATFQKDVLSWLGDHVAVGGIISDAFLAQVDPKANPQTMRIKGPDALAILTIKDEAGADAFLKAVLAVVEKQGLKFTTADAKLNGNAATIYSNVLAQVSIVRTAGYAVIGPSSAVTAMIDVITNKKPTLGADPSYKKVVGLLDPNSGLIAYFGQRLFHLQFLTAQFSPRLMDSTPQANATPEATDPQQALLSDAYKVIDGIALAARSSGKLLALDIAAATNPDAIKKYTDLLGLPANMLAQKPLSGKLIGQIPSNAMAVIFGSNLAQIYTQAQQQLIALSKFTANMGRAPGLNTDQAEQGFEQIEKGLQEAFDLDIKADILSWTGGEFALYMTPNKTGDLAVASKGQWPFDNTLIVATTDTAKANSFVEKLNTGLAGKVGVKPVSLGDKLYTVAGDSPVRVGYGVAGDTFILSTGSGVTPAATAIKGTDTLTSGGSTAWKNVSALLPKSYNQLLFLDLTAVYSYAKNAADSMKSSSLADRQSVGQALGLLDEFESAVIYSTSADANTVVSTLGLILK